MHLLERFLSKFATSSRQQQLFCVAGFVLAAVGIKWLELKLWGSDVPYWDQWGAEGLSVLIPFSDGSLDIFKMFFAAHNEHHIGLTRLWTLAVTAWNRQWDPLLICTLNALVNAATGAYLLHKFWPAAAGWLRMATALILLALFSSPITYQNLTNSFQSQFYFLLIFGIVHIGLVSDSKAGSWRWTVGMAAGIFGLWTMASGFLASIAVITVRLVKALHARRWSRGDTLTVIVCAVIAISGVAMINHVPANRIFQAHGVADFLSTIARIGALPFPNTPALFLVVQAPLAWWLIRRISNVHAPWTAEGTFLFTFSVWLVFQAAALAYGRAHYSGALAPRYLDILGLSLAADIGALALLARDFTSRYPNTLRFVVFSWLVLVSIGFIGQSHQHYRTARLTAGLWPLRADHIRRFLGTGDENALRKIPAEEMVSSNDEELIRLLRDERLRPLLPSSIRPPVNFEPAEVSRFTEGRPTGVSSPPAEYTKTWHSADDAPGFWHSAPKPVDELLPILRIRFAGSAQLSNRSLRLVTDDGRESDLEVTGLMGDRWQRGHLFVPASAKTVALVAEKTPPETWLAFAEPVEVGWGSYISEELRESSRILIISGGIILGFGLIFPSILVPQSEESDDGDSKSR